MILMQIVPFMVIYWLDSSGLNKRIGFKVSCCPGESSYRLVFPPAPTVGAPYVQNRRMPPHIRRFPSCRSSFPSL